jgi:3-methyladenine DNA glycosylase AlkD
MSPTSTSPVTAASTRFVAEHLDAARALGERLPALVGDPGAFAAALRAGFASLGDPVYTAGVRSVTPGLGPVFGVRQPLMEAVHRSIKRGTRQTAPALLLDCAARLFDEEQREMRWLGIWMLSRLLPAEPDRAWLLLRKAAALADEWITVDTLAHPWGEGVLRDPARWAELDRLVGSPSRWERRLVGSTLATMPFAPRGLGARDPVVARRALEFVERLIGDAEPDVQKALSWALRSLLLVDAAAVTHFLDTQTAAARAGGDGYRAWVIRDTLPKLPTETAARLRRELEGIRRRPGAPATSLALAREPATTAFRSTAP